MFVTRYLGWNVAIVALILAGAPLGESFVANLCVVSAAVFWGSALGDGAWWLWNRRKG